MRQWLCRGICQACYNKLVARGLALPPTKTVTAILLPKRRTRVEKGLRETPWDK